MWVFFAKTKNVLIAVLVVGPDASQASMSCWVQVAAVHGLELPQLVEPQSVAVGDLHHGGVPVDRLPALGPCRGHALDLGVGVVEQCLQFLARVGPLGRPAVVLLDVRGGVPLEEDLSRVGAEELLTDAVPAVIGMADVSREGPQCRLIAA